MYITNRQCQLCSQCGLTEYIRTLQREGGHRLRVADCLPGRRSRSRTSDSQCRPHHVHSNRRCATEVPRCPDDNYESQEIRTGYTDEQQQWVAAQPRICEPLRDCGETQYEPTDTRGSRTCALMQLRTDFCTVPIASACRSLSAHTDSTRSCLLHFAPRATTPSDTVGTGCARAGALPVGMATTKRGTHQQQTIEYACRYQPVEMVSGRPLVTGYNENLGDRECTDWRQCGPGHIRR